jgi:hypothetical protein
MRRAWINRVIDGRGPRTEKGKRKRIWCQR